MTGDASVDIVVHRVKQSRPVEMAVQFLVSLMHVEVTSCGDIMTFSNELLARFSSGQVKA